MAQVHHLTDSNFEAEVDESKIPTLIFFWAGWSMSCRELGKVLSDLAQAYEGKIKFAKLNVDENPKITSRFGVRTLPTICICVKNEEMERLTGVPAEGELRVTLDRYLEKPEELEKLKIKEKKAVAKAKKIRRSKKK